MFWNAILPGYHGNSGLALWKYIESCLRMESVYAQIVDQIHGGYENLDKVLDFGSGHGRLTRVLVHRMPREKIWVSDIYAHAVAWQADAFGVNGVVSVKSPDKFSMPLDFSVVFAGSVFSHLPEKLFHSWLARLYKCVSPGGVLMFSVHDGVLLPMGESLDASGYRYLKFSESESLDSDVYGMTYVSEDWVTKCVADVLGASGARAIRFPKGLYENQDLYIVGDRSVVGDHIRLVASPLAGFDRISLKPEGALLCEGWAMDFSGDGASPGMIVADTPSGEQLQGRVLGENPAASAYFPGSRVKPVKWELSVPAAVVRNGGVLVARFVGSGGGVGHAYLSLDASARDGGAAT